jgi:hypothetical protein
MAQTRRKRQTKHRGNAAGVVESRGRTGRKPTAEEKNPATRQATKSREQRQRDRGDRPPTWRGSFYRAMIMAVVLLGVILIFKIGSANSAIALFPIVLIAYWPISYYSERWVYNRKQRAKGSGRAKRGGQ